MVTILNKYVLCVGCGQNWVKKVYAGHENKPLCKGCRGQKVKPKAKRQRRATT